MHLTSQPASRLLPRTQHGRRHLNSHYMNIMKAIWLLIMVVLPACTATNTGARGIPVEDCSDLSGIGLTDAEAVAGCSSRNVSHYQTIYYHELRKLRISRHEVNIHFCVNSAGDVISAEIMSEEKMPIDHLMEGYFSLIRFPRLKKENCFVQPFLFAKDEYREKL